MKLKVEKKGKYITEVYLKILYIKFYLKSNFLNQLLLFYYKYKDSMLKLIDTINDNVESKINEKLTKQVKSIIVIIIIIKNKNDKLVLTNN